MATAKKSAQAAGKTTPARKAPAKKTATKKPAVKKTAAKKAPAKKPAAKKATGGRKYAPEASKDVEREMRAMKEGKLTIGKSKKKVTNPKQAIAIGLAEARREGADVPPNPNDPKHS